MPRIRYENDPEKRAKYLAYFKGVYANERDKRRAYQKQFYSVPSNKIAVLLYQIKIRCKKLSIPFDITMGDITIPSHCPYLGWELTYTTGQGRLDTTASIDKINPELGYIKGNVQVISDMANRMKNSATKEQLVLFAQNVLRLNQ